MDAIEFVKQLRRMDEKKALKNHFIYPCVGRETDSPEDVVSEVEQWSKEHPVKTRQSEFLKMFPNALIVGEDALGIYPCKIDKTIRLVACSGDCTRCRRDYWLQEVE